MEPYTPIEFISRSSIPPKARDAVSSRRTTLSYLASPTYHGAHPNTDVSLSHHTNFIRQQQHHYVHYTSKELASDLFPAPSSSCKYLHTCVRHCPSGKMRKKLAPV